MKPFIFRILYKLQILRLFPQFYFHYEVKKYINRNDVVIDIGANWGCYTRIFSDLGAEVYAFEPINKFYQQLRKIKNCWALPFAVGDKKRLIKMEQWRNTSGAYRISDEGTIDGVMVSGNYYCENLPKINFIKIDVEGSELPIIEDMAELILKHKPTILIETGKINEVLSYLPGYKIKDRMSNDYLIGV